MTLSAEPEYAAPLFHQITQTPRTNVSLMELRLCLFSKPDLSLVSGGGSMLNLVSKSGILRSAESSLNLWLKKIVVTMLLEIFLTSQSVNRVPCFVWHALRKVT